MERIQQRRFQMISERPAFEATKTFVGLTRKFWEEGREVVGAFWKYMWAPTEKNKKHLGEELADVGFILFDIASLAHIDLGHEMESKLQKDEKRFPIENMQLRPGETPKQVYRRQKRANGEI